MSYSYERQTQYEYNRPDTFCEAINWVLVPGPLDAVKNACLQNEGEVRDPIGSGFFARYAFYATAAVTIGGAVLLANGDQRFALIAKVGLAATSLAAVFVCGVALRIKEAVLLQRFY